MAQLNSWRANTPAFNNGENRKKLIISAVVLLLIVIIVFVLCFKFCGSSNDKDSSKKANNPKTSEIKHAAKKENNLDMVDPENMDTMKNDVGVNINAGDLEEQSGSANGIDVSKWQGKINWQNVKSSGINFAIIRIGFRAEDGYIYKDTCADYNIQQAQKAGVLVGVYFFSTATSVAEAKEEASWTASAIAGYPISYPVIYDCEGFSSTSSRMYGISKSKRTDIALAFLNSVKSAGYESMLYSAKSELENSTSWDTPRIEKSHKVWVAHYSQTPYPQQKKPQYSGKYSMWQYTNRGNVKGISGNTDLVVSYFTRSEAQPKNPSAKNPIATAPSGDSKIYTTVNDSVTAKELTNLRDAANTKGNIVATLKNGQFISRTGTGSNGWSKLIYNGKTVYAITSYLTTDHNYSTTTLPNNMVNGQTFSNVNEKVTAKDMTNLRNAPTKDGAVVVTIKNGEFVTRTGVGDKGWSRLTYDGKTVYAITSYLTDKLNSTDQITISTTKSTTSISGLQFKDINDSVTAKIETNLRSSPSSKDNSNVVILLKNGEYVTRTGVSDNGWSRLIYNGQTVYAVTKYLIN
ncbi:MAG: GH25 family lysozyme [Oscillospiraceae bacterium]